MCKKISIFYCLFLNIGIANAEEGCLNPQIIGQIWRNGGKEMLYTFLKNEKKIDLNTTNHYIPEIRTLLNERTNPSGERMCEYSHEGASEPFFVLNMGKPIMKKLEKSKR